MWNIVVLIIMISVGGYYALVDQQYVVTTERNRGAQLANDMGVYRQLVVSYFSADPELKNLSASISDLNGVKPDWIRSETLTRWNNYIDSRGVIYIFGVAPLPVNITADIVALSQNSVLAGEARLTGGALRLFAPADRSTIDSVPVTGRGELAEVLEAIDYGEHAPINLPVAAAIPTGSPVWLAVSERTNLCGCPL